MIRKRRINVKRIILGIESVYKDNELCSLLFKYADGICKGDNKKIECPDFFEAVRDAVFPEKVTDADKIADILLKRRSNYTYKELECFFEYAVLWALIELNVPYRSDSELCDTLNYFKALERIDTDRLFFLLCEAERILSESDFFADSVDGTKNECRSNVKSYARRFSISETEAAKILCSSSPLKEKRRYAPALYFAIMLVLFTAFLLISAYLLEGSIPLLLFLSIPISELSKQICDTIFSHLIKPRPIPRKKLKYIPEEAKTLCVITSLIKRKEDAASLVKKLLSCYFANRDKNVLFGVLCDLGESDYAEEKGDGELIDFIKEEIYKANEKYECRLCLFIRKRKFCACENKYMGWERKRGAIIELSRLLVGKESGITAYGCETKELQGIRYVVTLDSDTRLYSGAVRDMVGAMVHPANRPRVKNGAVVSGHAIMQPRMESSLLSAEKTPFSILCAGNGGSDIYANAAYEAYQSIFGEGIFCGKGIFDLHVFASVIDGAFPDQTVLSHDLPEGIRLRAAALTEISLTDDIPSSPMAHFDRSHRWIRGDLQNLAISGKYIRSSDGKLYKNPISALSRYKIYDNIRRASLPVFACISILLSVFYGGRISLFATVTAISYLLYPFLLSIITLITRSGRRFFSFTLPGVQNAAANLLYSLCSLFHSATVSADAMIRAGFRLLISGKHLLEWKTASESERGIRGLPLYLYKMLPSILTGAAIVAFVREPLAVLLGTLWMLFPFAAYFLGREFTSSPALSRSKQRIITEYAYDIWKFFADNVNSESSYLPPDNVQQSPVEVTAWRTSPTNIGLYLLSCVAAHDFGFISLSEMLTRLKQTFGSIDRLQKWKGHLYNWYDTKTLDILGSPYVSSVDSGNFISCLVALVSALDEIEEATQSIKEIKEKAEELILADMRVLYDEKKKLFKIGINTAGDEAGDNCYDLFMSEARTTSYFAIATSQVEREHWKSLSRPLICRDGYIGLASWTGTMFEYMMPALLLPTRFGSLSYESLLFAIREQRRDTANGIWGRSESGYFLFDADMNYQYKAFGAASLGIKRGLENDTVISPYSSFLCLYESAENALNNLQRIKEMGAYGKYGFFEAIDLTRSRVGKGRAIIRSYMSHHMGMSLISCANACYDNVFPKRFMSNPQMASCAELLEEKIPINARVAKNVGRRLRKSTEPVPRLRSERPAPADTYLSPSMPYASVISDGTCSIIGSTDMLKFSFDGIDLSCDPFVFGDIHRPRLLFSADGKKYDALSGAFSTGGAQSRFVFDLDEKELSARTSVSLSGRHRALVISLEVMGNFSEICPMLCFEPTLSSTKEREGHIAYSDIMVSAEYLESEKLILYSKKGRNGPRDDVFLAVSFESRGGKESFETSRDILGLMYGEEDIISLLDKDFSCKTGALINPFCAIKKKSESKSGKYLCNIILASGRSRDSAVSSLISAREEIYGKGGKRKNGARIFSSLISKPISERLALCSGMCDISRYLTLLCSCMIKRRAVSEDRSIHSVNELWCHGISGDLPIFCLDVCDDVFKSEPIKRHIAGFVSAHKYLALSGIRTDLVIVYQSNGDYGGEQLRAIRELIRGCACEFMIGHSGGIFLIDGKEKAGAIMGSAVMLVSLDRESTLQSFEKDHIKPKEERSKTVTKPAQFIEPSVSEDELSVHGGVFRKKGFAIFKGKQKNPWSYVYAGRHFGTLITQNSLGYTWIGNCHQRRITPFLPDNLLDMSGERLILSQDGTEYDLCACSSSVTFGRGGGYYTGSIGKTEYKISVTIDPRLPCKIVSLEINEDALVEYRITPVMGERITPSRRVITVRDGADEKYIPTLISDGRYDIGFLHKKASGDHRLFILGAYPEGGEATLDAIIKKYSSKESVSAVFSEYESEISAHLPSERIRMSDPYLNRMVSYYLPYQALVCRFFARTGFYQSGGAYGFRDQLQDCLCIMKGAPDLARVHLLRCASHQYEEGDVMHWWHTVGGRSRGVRTRYSDDCLWLPFVASKYTELTGDFDIFKTDLPYLSSPPLKENEDHRYEEGKKSKYRESLYAHCVRAIGKSLKLGSHSLPLMGGGDWNDGMNRVGKNGGESVWLGMFLILVLESFIPIVLRSGDLSLAQKYRDTVKELKTACEAAFKGGKFIRAYYGDGKGVMAEDGEIDALPQAFAALARLDKQKTLSGLLLAEKLLFDRENRIFKLLTPPYSRSERSDPGYIAAYPAGIRENGGQYSHASVWTAMGCALSGMTDLAAEILATINPARICADKKHAEIYRAEPYFVAGDVSSNQAFPGRCGWSLYTGAASWYYIAVSEALMGFEFFPDGFSIHPRLSEHFDMYGIKFIKNGTEYTVLASLGDKSECRLDGKISNNLFYYDKNSHLIEITVEKTKNLQ